MNIYKITSTFTNQVYVGKTKTTLKKRFGSHKSNYKAHLKGELSEKGEGVCTSIHILKYSDAKIELLEVCEPGDDAGQRERWWIENTENTVNKVIPTQTPMEYYWNTPGYREKQVVAMRERYANRTPKQIQEQQAYYQEHRQRPETKEVQRKSRARTRDARLKRRREAKATCEYCGFVGMKENLARHQRSRNCTKPKD
jgi:hypothetical protein